MIDTARIEELRAEIGGDDLAFIVSVYLDEARDSLRQIAEGLPPEKHLRMLHFLRSGALNIGLRGIAETAAVLETNDPIDTEGCANRIGEAIARTQAELASAPVQGRVP